MPAPTVERLSNAWNEYLSHRRTADEAAKCYGQGMTGKKLKLLAKIDPAFQDIFFEIPKVCNRTGRPEVRTTMRLVHLAFDESARNRRRKQRSNS